MLFSHPVRTKSINSPKGAKKYMSMPNIPDVDATISITRENSIDLLLASIAFEELGLSHIINAEAEKIQYAVGTLDTKPTVPPTIEQLIAVNNSAARTLRSVIGTEMLLTFKLEDILESTVTKVYENTALVTAEYEGVAVSDSDTAFYHTEGGARV